MATATRMTSARLVGRSAQLAELEAVVHDAAGGRPSLAFVAGESGVGKTRLTSELIRRARENGVRVLSGDCVELGEGELPYAPLVGALRPLVRDRDPAFDALPATLHTELAAILPTLGSARPDADAARKGRLFEALLELLDRLGGETPVLLVIEDLHWADRSTRGFLTFLARTLCRERVAVVATYRSDELHRRHPLRPLLAELERDQATRRIELHSFTRDELAEQLGEILGSTPDAGLVDRVLVRSEGNPLFTEEILAAGLDGRGALPPTLRDALMVRIERLSQPAQDLLRLLVGTAMDDALLEETSTLEPRELRDALRETVASHIVVAGDDDRYRFRHALLREVLLDDLLPGERTELHRTLARALEQRVALEDRPDAHLTAQVAYHWLHAGDQPAALAACVRAAAASERVNAFGEAGALLEQALELWERVPEEQRPPGVDRVDLLARAAQHAADGEGDYHRQEALLRRALSLVSEQEQPRRAAMLLERLQRAQWHLNRPEETIATIDRALALLDPEERSHERVALLAAKARVRMLQSRYREAVELAEETMALAEEVGDHAVASRLRNALGSALVGLGDAEAGEARLREGLAIARERGLLDETLTSYGNLADVLHVTGRTREALEITHRGRDELREHGRRVDWLTLDSVEYAIAAGDWEGAALDLASLDGRHYGKTLMHRHLRQAELALGRGEHEQARTELDATARTARDSTEPQYLGPLGALRAELERRTGDLLAARAAVDDALDRIEFCSDDITQVTGVSGVGLRVEADAAQRARDRDDAEGEREARLRAELLLARVEAGAELERAPLLAELATARAEEARARGEDDPALWVDAAAAWAQLGRPYFSAYASWRQAEASAAAGDRDAAAAAAREAHASAQRLGAAWLVGEVDALAARARLSLDDAGSSPAAARGDGAAGGSPAEADPFGLTPRERQVLTLVASGATNREIGSALFMAEKTASVHVSRILAKLDVRSRTQAAAVAHRLGLDEQ
ncbi:ATP-binding protein [Conexibacter woesei]|uniref:Transcriptional regulator, LuxR family n=1 Tax=Conexibacter woesei (strain DSM 14684 / CCUG 47730 / CIP 108061 / JCM 11494 / NBRC 100937 / ID131577) TaxID=469383 RepID=D3FFE6_CONWI|nr:helix-turn-helix transcriptional regulator [Conexibacter woesei]ADB53739.1 transcriptional regulator, LuxR family [Conexibacter woesei DSM 14684]